MPAPHREDETMRARHRGRHRSLSVVLLSVLAAGAGSAPAQANAGPKAASPLTDADICRAIAQGHAQLCRELYRDSEAAAKTLQQRIGEMLARPDRATLAAARSAWTAARRFYCQTEAFRFYEGPVDAIEGYLNAWPVDEAYIDSVRGRPDAGIINDERHYPNLGATVLLLANERGGEANISVGWHAIEFLLWGQDFDPHGPGDRPPTDFVAGGAPHAERRCEYLRVITDLLVQHLGQLAAAWAPDADDYRRAFEQKPDAAVRKILTGAAILTAFELGGERLAVAYETRDQEQEHCCFSDTTRDDLVADQLGIQNSLTCTRDGRRVGASVLDLLERRDRAVAADVAQKLAASLAALRAIPQPFDQAILGDDDAPGRTAIRAALAALDAQAEALEIAGRVLGFELPLKPGK
jgi:putative iron-regulated protein